MRNHFLVVPVRTVVTLALLLTIFAGISSASGPMPYTEDALNRLDSAKLKIKVPTDIQDDNDYKVKAYIGAYRKIFALAGYNYEQSLIKTIKDIQSDTYVVNKTTITLNNLARELLRLHVKTGISPRKYLSRECADLLIGFRDLIRSNMKKYGGC
ncbi:MAG TPA: hypothetical protein VGJ93_11260 [Desulfuromonadaceae bacterium]